MNMKVLYLLLNKFNKKPLQIIILVEIVLSMTLFMMVAGKMEYYRAPLKAFDENRLENSVLFSFDIDAVLNGTEKEYMDKFDNLVKKSPYIAQTGTTYSLSCGFPVDEIKGTKYYDYYEKLNLIPDPNNPEKFDATHTFALIYDEEVAKNLYLPILDGGNQLINADVGNDVIPMIMSNKYSKLFNVGETHNMLLYWNERGSEEFDFNENGDITGYTMTGRRLPVRVYIAGFLQKDDYMINLESGDSNFPADYIFRRGISDFIILKSNSGPIKDINMHTGFSTQMVTFRNSADMEKGMVELDELGNVNTFSRVIKNTKTNYQISIREPLVNFIICLGISIISILGLNILLSSLELKEYGIYFAYGCSWKKCFLIDFSKSFISLLIPSILAAVIINFLAINDDTTIINSRVYFFSFLVVVSTYLLSSFLFNIKILKTNPVDCIREDE